MNDVRLKSLFDRRIEERQGIVGRFLDPRVLLDVFVSVIKENIGTIGKEAYEEIVAYAEAMYETHVRPYDLPGVPNGRVEDMVDDILKGAIRPGIRQVFVALGVDIP